MRGLVLPITLLLLVTGGCGPADRAIGASEPSVTLVLGQRGESFSQALACAARKEAAASGVDLEVLGAETYDATQQNPIIESAVTRRPDALIVAPVDASASTEPLRRAVRAGLPTILVDTIVTDRTIGLSRIASDNVEGGRIAARELLALLNGRAGEVLYVGTIPGASASDQRGVGFEQELRRRRGLQLLPSIYAENDAGKAERLVADHLRRHTRLVGIFAGSAASAEGAATALRDSGKAGRVAVVGFDASPTEVGDVRDGTVGALVVQEPREMGRRAVSDAVRALRGEHTQKDVTTATVVLTSENLASPQVARSVYTSTC